MKKLYILISLLLAATAAFGQKSYEGEIRHTPEVTRSGDKVNIKFEMDFSDMRIKSQQMVEFTPYVTAADGSNVIILEPVIVAGPKRYRYLQRELKYGTKVFSPEPAAIMKHRNRRNETISLEFTVPYESWFHSAEIMVAEEVSGCVRCGSYIDEVDVAEFMPPMFIPQYRSSLAEPPAEQVKERSESYKAYVNYEVGKHNLLRNYKNNAKVLGEVDAVMRELMNDKDLDITRFKVIGYASPEGNFASNRTLSENRARSFLKYIYDKFGYDTSLIEYEGMGEDWNGLYEAVAKSNISGRERVLGIIDGTQNIAARKKQLQALDGGRTYRYLLDNMYPPLRRNEYEISFVARPFDVAEAREIIKTNPGLLSQSEIFLVANSYPKDSREYNETFEIAARLFPNDPYAKVNASAVEIKSGKFVEAISRLQGVDMLEAYNNLGIAHFSIGQYDLAERYFRLAAANGNADSIHNLEQFTQWMGN